VAPTAIARRARYRPLALAVLRVEQGQLSRPWTEPAGAVRAFDLPMSFPPSHRSNKDEFNAKEAR
jgi:hypothetical protein